jgi:hypothetical protein
MSSLSAPKPPKVDDYQKVSGLQTEANTKAMNDLYNLSAANQINPYGQLTYYTDPVTGKMTANQQLSADQQFLLDTLQRTQGVGGTDAGELLANANYGDVPDFGSMSSPLVEERLNAYTQFNKPYYEYATQELDTKLRNQGIVPGDEQYDFQMKALRDQQATQQSKAASDYAPQAWQQAVENYKMPAAMAVELAKFGSPASLMQNLWSTPQAQGSQGANVIGANANMNSANMDRYKAEMQNRADMMKAIGQVGMGGVMLATGGVGGLGLGGLSSLMGGGAMSADAFQQQFMDPRFNGGNSYSR